MKIGLCQGNDFVADFIIGAIRGEELDLLWRTDLVATSAGLLIGDTPDTLIVNYEVGERAIAELSETLRQQNPGGRVLVTVTEALPPKYISDLLFKFGASGIAAIDTDRPAEFVGALSAIQDGLMFCQPAACVPFQCRLAA